MLGDRGFFFKHGNPLTGEAFEEAVSGGKANDAAADDDEVGIHGKGARGERSGTGKNCKRCGNRNGETAVPQAQAVPSTSYQERRGPCLDQTAIGP